MSNTGENAELVKRFEAAVKANGYRTCDDNTEREYIDAKNALTATLAAADARIAEWERVADKLQDQIHKYDGLLDAEIARRETAEQELERIKAINVKHCETVNTLLVDGSQWQAKAETAETLLEEARRALAPFIRLADNVFSDGKNATVADEVTLWCFNDTDITFGDLRRARATLDRIRSGGEE